MFEEFKKFAMRGNVVDLAVGVVIGASFTGIINSLVNDVIMPPIGLALGGVVAAPIGAWACKRVPQKPMMVLVGMLVMGLSIRTLIRSFS